MQKVTIAKNKQSQNAEDLRWAFDMTELLWYEKRLYIPSEASVQTELLKCHHDNELTEHFSIEWTLELVSHKYYWPKLVKDVKKYVFSCNICQRVKMSRHHSYGEMQALPHSNSLWKKVIMNIITGLSSSKHSDNVYDVILMIVDHYIKMTQYISISKTLIAMQLADIFFEKIVCHYRTLKEIVSDRDSIFTSSYWLKVCYQMKIKCRLSTTFHSQMNEQTEHQNQTLKHYLQCYCNEEQSNWVKLLSLAKFAYINTKQFTLRCSLFYVMTEYNSFIHYNIKNNIWEEEVPTVKNRVKQLHKACEKLLKQWKSTVASQVKAYNQRHRPKTYNKNDLVLLLIKNLSQKRLNKKLSHKFAESFHIQDIIEKQAYCLYLPTHYWIHNVFHVSYLEPYNWHLNDEITQVLLSSELINKKEEYKIEEILKKQRRKGELWYKVKWIGYSSEYDQWISEQDLDDASELCEMYDVRVKKRHQRWNTAKTKTRSCIQLIKQLHLKVH